ncbi:MAG TPA: erythromycin esterase, partial [Xanthobacteraceae bacterium]|nr:erythromycin esterase [Xanthobacteraceae bacterium]
RNRAVANALNAHGFATLLFDLLTPSEEGDRANVFDIPLLGQRLVDAVQWLGRDARTSGYRLGLFGAPTGAAAALVAAARLGEKVGAVMSRGGRPDLAAPWSWSARPLSSSWEGPTTWSSSSTSRHWHACKAPKALEIVPGASHLFPEPGALEAVIDHAARWFGSYLAPGAAGLSRTAATIERGPAAERPRGA